MSPSSLPTLQVDRLDCESVHKTLHGENLNGSMDDTGTTQWIATQVSLSAYLWIGFDSLTDSSAVKVWRKGQMYEDAVYRTTICHLARKCPDEGVS